MLCHKAVWNIWTNTQTRVWQPAFCALRGLMCLRVSFCLLKNPSSRTTKLIFYIFKTSRAQSFEDLSYWSSTKLMFLHSSYNYNGVCKGKQPGSYRNTGIYVAIGSKSTFVCVRERERPCVSTSWLICWGLDQNPTHNWSLSQLWFGFWCNSFCY